jgi:RimJ/RimL family protein N-acetyltransferase
MNLRPATQADARLLFEWRNHPTTRAMSRTKGEIQFDQHCEWLRGVLSNPLRTLYIAEEQGVPVGTVRLDRSDMTVEASWTIAPEHRGNGYGKEMVKAAIDNLPGDVEIIAEVQPDNPASIKIAEAAGLRFTRKTEDGLLRYARHQIPLVTRS